jgi:hypothetical protein
LESTLIRAEALFRHFQRVVEAIDKKENFPGPRKEGQAAEVEDKDKGKGKASPKQLPEKVITPELRKLLSRKVEILSRSTVAQKGDGMPGK